MNKLNAKLVTVVLATITTLLTLTIAVSAAELVQIRNQTHPNAIADQFVITFDDAHSMMGAINSVRASGGTILHTYPSINGFAADLPADALSIIRANKNLVSIEANVLVGMLRDDIPTTITNPLNWGVDRIDGEMNQSYTYNSNGEGVNVYVIDSGIDDTHHLLAGHVVQAFDNVGDGRVSCGDHGTSVASIIGGETGVANGVTLHSVRVFDCNIVRGHAEILAGLEWIGENAESPAVVNASIAMYGGVVYNLAVEALIAQGITVVASAGNDYRFSACDVSPAGGNGVITVGASDIDDAVADFNSTNEGNCINSYAPGVDVKVANDSGDIVTGSGTSLAAPHVTGCVARYLQNNPTTTPADMLTLIETASASGILNCSFADILPNGDTLLNAINEESNLSITVPLSVGMNQIAIHTNTVMFAFIVLLILATITTAVYGWERR